MRPVRQCKPNRPLTMAVLGLCWFMLALCWLCWSYAGFMLALCWTYVGSSWMKLGQVGSCWLMLVQVGLKMRLCWLKIPENHRNTPPKASKRPNFRDFWSKFGHFGTPRIFKNWKKHVFYRSVCNLHFFVALNACLGLQVGSGSLQVGSCWLTWTKLSPSWTKLAPTWLKMRHFCPKLASQKKRFWVRKKPVGSKLAPNLLLEGQGASPRGCTHPLA